MTERAVLLRQNGGWHVDHIGCLAKTVSGKAKLLERGGEKLYDRSLVVWLALRLYIAGELSQCVYDRRHGAGRLTNALRKGVEGVLARHELDATLSEVLA